MKFSEVQIKAIQQRALADAEADYKRLTAAGYTDEQAQHIMRELAPERALQSWAAHQDEYLSPEAGATAEATPDPEPPQTGKHWWEFWKQ
jgi:hypothetical protein